MGCSAAKNLTVEPLDIENQHVTNITNGHAVQNAQEIDIKETAQLENVNNVQQGTNGLSFEIAFQDEEAEESIIKKHPPKRFQRLEEQQTNPEKTLEKLQEKLDEAEIRRQQILQQRVQSAKCRQNLKKQQSIDEDEDDPQHLKVPKEDVQTTNPYDVAYI